MWVIITFYLLLHVSNIECGSLFDPMTLIKTLDNRFSSFAQKIV